MSPPPLLPSITFAQHLTSVHNTLMGYWSGYMVRVHGQGTWFYIRVLIRVHGRPVISGLLLADDMVTTNYELNEYVFFLLNGVGEGRGDC